MLGPHPTTDSPVYLAEAQVKCYPPSEYLKNSLPWMEYTRVLRENSVLPTILRSYGRAAETFPASDKGWHGFFVETPYGPKFLHPTQGASRGPGFSMGVCPALLPHPGMAAHKKLDPTPWPTWVC